MAKVKVSFNKHHRKYEIYYHMRGKQHVCYRYTADGAAMAAEAAQRVVDRL